MREDTNEVSANEMLLIFESNPVNEGLARVTAASFCTQLNPTLEEIADLKTAVSEAVTNCIIHGYEGRRGRIEMHLSYRERELYVDITDHGVGISDVEKAMEPMYTSKPGRYECLRDEQQQAAWRIYLAHLYHQEACAALDRLFP